MEQNAPPRTMTLPVRLLCVLASTSVLILDDLLAMLMFNSTHSLVFPKSRTNNPNEHRRHQIMPTFVSKSGQNRKTDL